MSTFKFQSDFNLTLEGFYDGRTPVKGILVDYARKSEFPFYVLEIQEDDPDTGIRLQDEQTGEALPESTYGVIKGQRIGLSNYAAFKGLERYVNHHITITPAGEQQLSRGRVKLNFDIDVSERPVRQPERRPNGRGPARPPTPPPSKA